MKQQVNSMDEISNDQLEIGMVPASDASWAEIAGFALTFDGYKHWGSFERCAEIANARRHGTLTDLRTCLFFEQRRWRYLGELPGPDEMQYFGELLDLVRKNLPAMRP
jgi:hypothetical protein